MLTRPQRVFAGNYRASLRAITEGRPYGVYLKFGIA